MRRRRSRPHGGRGGAEPLARIRLRELRVMEQILIGQSQHQIATALGISQPAVSKIVARIEARLLDDVAWKVDRQRARHTLRLEYLYAEAMRAWRASQDDGLRKRQRKTDGSGGAATTIAEIVSENRHGDPRYLEAARQMLADLRTLWGVNAPEQVGVQVSRYADMSDAALDTELARYAQLLEPASDPATHPARSEDTDATHPDETRSGRAPT